MSAKVILCTGANQGLGFSILQVAALRYPENTYILCSRDMSAGQEATQKLGGVTAKIDLVQLDVTNDEQITAAVDYVATTYGKLDGIWVPSHKSFHQKSQDRVFQFNHFSTVLINNAGILRRPPSDNNLSGIREIYNEMLNVNLTSVAVITTAFTPLLYKSPDPKVINVSSGLGSIQNTLTVKMGRNVPYGTSKIGLNGLTAHMQVAENDRVQANPEGRKPKIRYFAVAPGVLKTAFTNYAIGKDPVDGAEVVVRLLGDKEDGSKFEGGSYWEFVDGEMRVVPW